MPLPNVRMQVPACVLDHRIVPRDDKNVMQVMIKWSLLPNALAKLEDFELLKQEFPHASAWGQVNFRQRGIASSTKATTDDRDATTSDKLHNRPPEEAVWRPKRNIRSDPHKLPQFMVP